ncbi:MAG: PAS domain-containing protein [Candidatus Omnitrophica bacterium]|nr:PAS domain-containing protein [Candidatus Omnitrophota bacterium]
MKAKTKGNKVAGKKVNYKDLVNKYKLLSSLMNHIPDVIYFKDKKGRLVMVNQAYAKGIGLKPRDIAGKTDFDFFPKERAQRMAEDDMYVMRTGKSIIDKIERATRVDGVDNYVTTTKMPRHNDKGQIIGLIGITRDITRRMQLMRLREEKTRVEKKLEALEGLNKMKSEFISVVSHELRTPLAIIKEALMLVFDEIAGPVNDKQKKVLIKAKDNIKRLGNIIDELLDISRIESGRFKLHYFLVNFNDLLKDSSEFFKRLAQDKGISLDYFLPKKQVNLFIDTDRISQALTNLINNAIKFTEQNGKIKVEVKILETKVRIGIIDTGIGIAKQNLPKLFNRFVQVPKVAGAERKGIGLGLSIAKELVEKHGGEIWAESKLGVGSKFYFTLPRFYSVELLDKQAKDRINNLLDKGKSVYLINLPIVNYKEFKKRIKISPRRLFEDLSSIMDVAFKESSRLQKEKPQIPLQDFRNGECSVLFPEAKEEEVTNVSNLLKNRIKKYFAENKLEGVFISTGILPYPAPTQLHKTERLPANVHIKKIYIGSEIRRFKRVYYKADIENFLPGSKTESGQTVDISEGGVCFVSERLLKTDTQVEIKLRLSKKKDTIFTQARVVWIKNMEQLLKKAVNKYKVGLEFVKLKNKDKKVLSKFIKSVST